MITPPDASPKTKKSLARRLLLPVARWILWHSPDYLAVQLKYFQIFRRLPNLRHPRTFNEKIAWRKLHQPNPLFTVFADKVAVKDRVAALIGSQHVIETLWVGEDPGAIPFDALQPPYVLKANHGSGGILFVRDGDEVDRPGLVAYLREQLALPYGHASRERAYLDIPPKVIVERMLEMPGQAVPQDYKFFVYHARAHFIQVDTDRFSGHKRAYFDRDWNRLPAQVVYPNATEVLPRPDTLDEMTRLAEKVGSLFDFVRVDFYSVPQGIFFGEATFYPGAGNENSPRRIGTSVSANRGSSDRSPSRIPFTPSPAPSQPLSRSVRTRPPTPPPVSSRLSRSRPCPSPCRPRKSPSRR